jgi:hypothetical protein
MGSELIGQMFIGMPTCVEVRTLNLSHIFIFYWRYYIFNSGMLRIANIAVQYVRGAPLTANYDRYHRGWRSI